MARAGVNWRRFMENLARLSNVPSRIARPISDRFTVRLKREFKEGADSYGTPWVPLKPSTVKRKGHPLIMIDTGKTRDETRSIVLSGSGIGFLSTSYAGYHMGKSGPRPARPIFPHKSELPPEWLDDIRVEWGKVFKSTFKGI